MKRTMKTYLKEMLLLLIQLLMFYVFPLFAGPTDAMGMVLLIFLSVLLLSFAMGVVSTKRFKYLYPTAVAVLFVPSVWIYYNDSALIHAFWYLAAASIGLVLGMLVRKIFA